VWPKPKLAVRLKTPHAEQRRFIDSSAKRKIIRAGRRSGKTTGVAILAVECFLDGARILYAAPTEEQTGAFWGEVRRCLARLVSEGVFSQNLTERFIEKPGSNQRIKATTAWSPDALRSDWADLLILDEWQLQNESVWEEVGAPMLLDTNGDCVFIYTPPSLRSRATSKARDPRHAAKMFKLAQQDKTGRWAAFHFTSHANPHISKAALAEISQDMTQLAIRQEIMAEDVEEVAGALWTQKLIDEGRVNAAPDLVRVVVAIDPSGSGKSTADECGIVVAGLGADGDGYILEDLSRRASPQLWASIGVSAYHRHHADRIVAEANFGADMVELTIRTVDESVSYRSVTASRGKIIRAEPVVALYEKHRVHHVGVFESLEDELTSYVPGNPSPGRLDSTVWALTELMLGSSGGWATELAHRWTLAGCPPISSETCFLDPQELDREASAEAAPGATESAEDVARTLGEAQKRESPTWLVKLPPKFGEVKGPGPPGKTVMPARTAQAGPCPKCGRPLSVYVMARKCNGCGFSDQGETKILAGV
jgi:hypothetical protein